MKKLLLLLLFLPVFVSAEIVIINETEKDFFTLETLHLSGDLQENELQISGSGQIIAGNQVKVYLLGPAEDIVIKDVYLNNVLVPISFDKQGYFIVVSGEGQFSFSGTMLIRRLGQLQLFIQGPVNELTFNLEHGYAVNGDRYGVYNKQVTIQRSEKAAMLVDGSFRYTYAQRNTFYYVINFKSFGSSLGQYTMQLPNAETISDVTGVLSWQQNGQTLVVELEGSQAVVSASGIFNSNNLRMPLNEGTHKVTIESDAEKKITISTTAREVDISESGLPYTFPNARAFLAKSTDSFKITVKDLEILPSLAASVRSATNRVAITDKGSVVGELTYQYANTGVDYIEMDVPGKPLYAAHQQGPVKLTKDDKFLLAFPKTQHGSLDLVYFDTVSKLGIIDLINVPLAKTDLPVTEQSTQIFVPGDYYVLQTFGAKGGTDLPGLTKILLFIVILGGLAAFLKKNLKFVIMYLICASGVLMFNMSIFYLLIAVTLFFIIKRYIGGKTWWKWALVGAGALIIIVVVLVAFTGMLRMSTSSGLNKARSMADYAEIEQVSAPMMKGMEMIGEDEDGAISIPTRKGVLPVKLELPRLGKQITVKNHLVTKENPVSLKILLLASWLKYLWIAFAALCGYYCYLRIPTNPKKSNNSSNQVSN